MSAREVELAGGAPWGFRMHGGADQNQPLRISRVNPGRKASLSGIREGDIISSINGRTTRGVTNAEAHALLRQAGPVLKLGLNEDREMSPRRRSIGKGGELKRPSQLIGDAGGSATPQAPVYATIRPAPSPLNRPVPPALRSSLNSLPSALSSTPLVKSVGAPEESIKIHPTNPFYTNSPPNSHSSPSKLPVPNGRASNSSLDRTTKPINYSSSADNYDGLKSPSFFTKSYDSGPNSLPPGPYLGITSDVHTNGYSNQSPKYAGSEVKREPFSYDSLYSQGISNGLPNVKANTESSRDPFDTSRLGSDPFEKYLRSNTKGNDYGYSKITNSLSENNVTEEMTTHSVTEHKISEIEEVKTIKKIILNGSGDETSPSLHESCYTPTPKRNQEFDFKNNHQPYSKTFEDNRREQSKTYEYSPSHNGSKDRFKHTDKISNGLNSSADRWNDERSFSSTYYSTQGKQHYASPTAVEVSIYDVASKPPLRTPSSCAPAQPTSPTAKQTVMIAPTFKARSTSPAVWRPGAPSPTAALAQPARSPGPAAGAPPPPPPPPVWSPGASPQTPRKNFRPVHFEETPPARRKFESTSADQNGCASGSEGEGRLRTSHSAPAAGLSSLGTPLGTPQSPAGRLPRAQNPTVTLLQKAREGQLARGSSYLQQERDSARLPRDRASPPRGDPVHALRREYASEGEAEREERGGRNMADARRKVDGIGPTTKDGMPVALRCEVKDPSRWYKKMYDTIHKNKYDDDYVTIRYQSRRGQQPQRVTNKSQYAYFDPRSGYLSEPEGGQNRLGGAWSDAYDSDVTTGPRRRTASVQEDRRNDNELQSPYLPSNKYSTLASARASHEVYKNQPGRIENYVPGKSSVVDQEAKQWWDEVMDIFDGQLSSTTSLPQAIPKEKKDITSAILSKSNMARALKESGYESDSQLVFRRRDETEGPLSPAERRAAYRDLQAGGEPPLRGFRSPAPPRTESPRRYVESDVNIHYRCPVRRAPLPLVPERELARQQAEHMQRLYREQKRTKYLQELQDMQSRRHQDNFTPAQKAVVPLNRYDEADRVVARSLYAFNGQTARELSFRKGDLIHVRRQIDANWYEGELHGRVGLFPYNYVEILKGDVAQSPKKPAPIEGRARAKFDFTAQTNLELPLKKGEVVVLTRRIDHNWWEGRNGAKTGIFPDSYVQVLQEPSPSKPEPPPTLSTEKPVASPAGHGLLTSSARRSMGAHSYTPQLNSPSLSNAPPATQPLPAYSTKPAQASLTPSERGYGPPTAAGVDLNNTEPLYVDTNAEAVPYRAMYKYRPQNPDELELNEGDTVYVLEKCDDGWYVGSSQRTGRFGTFPGNYVERI